MAVCLYEQALKRSLDTRTATKAQPAASKTVLITWDEEDPSANPTSSPSEDTAEPQIAGDITAKGDSSAAANRGAGAAAESAAPGAAAAAAADEWVRAVAAVVKADVAARASDARAAAELSAADAGTAAAAAAANAGVVAADAVRSAQIAADTAAAESTAAAAASMAAAAAIDADATAANADVSGARTASKLAAAFSKDLAAHLTPGVGNFIPPVADVSGARTAGELAAAFSKELAAHLTPRFVEWNTQAATAAARKDRSMRQFKQAAAPGEREVPVKMVDDMADHPTSKERATTGAWNGRVRGSVASDQSHLVAMVWAVLACFALCLLTLSARVVLLTGWHLLV